MIIRKTWQLRHFFGKWGKTFASLEPWVSLGFLSLGQATTPHWGDSKVASGRPRSLEYFIWGPLWRHSAITLVKIVSFEPYLIYCSISRSRSWAKENVSSKAESDLPKGTRDRKPQRPYRGHQQSLRSRSKVGQTPETPPSWFTIGSQLQNHNLSGTDLEDSKIGLTVCISIFLFVLCMLSLGSFLERQEGSQLALWVPTLSLGKSAAFTAVPGQIQSNDYHYQTILTASIKLHYTYIPVHLFLLDSWKTRVPCTIVPRYSRIFTEHINMTSFHILIYYMGPGVRENKFIVPVLPLTSSVILDNTSQSLSFLISKMGLKIVPTS